MIVAAAARHMTIKLVELRDSTDVGIGHGVLTLFQASIFANPNIACLAGVRNEDCRKN